MPMGVFDFKAINRKLNCQEQKADFEEKNPKPDPNKVVWSPEWGYGMAPLAIRTDPELLRKLYQEAADCAALSCRGATVRVKPSEVNEAARRYMSEKLSWLGEDVAERWKGL